MIQHINHVNYTVAYSGETPNLKHCLETPLKVLKTHEKERLIDKKLDISNPTFANLHELKKKNGDESSVLDYVSYVKQSDVLFGGTICHEGNQTFQELLSLHGPDYIRSIKLKKLTIARRVVEEMKKCNPLVRFLKREEWSERWYTVSDRDAEKETCRALGEDMFKENVTTECALKDEEFVLHDQADSCPKDIKRKHDSNVHKEDFKKPKLHGIEYSRDFDANVDVNNERSKVNNPFLNTIAEYLATQQKLSHVSMLPKLQPYGLNSIKSQVGSGIKGGLMQQNRYYGNSGSLPHLSPYDDVSFAIKAAEIRSIGNTMNGIRYAEAMRRSFVSTLSNKATIQNNVSTDLKLLSSVEALRNNFEKITNDLQGIEAARLKFLDSAVDSKESLFSVAAKLEVPDYLKKALNEIRLSEATKRSPLTSTITDYPEMQNSIKNAMHEIERRSTLDVYTNDSRLVDAGRSTSGPVASNKDDKLLGLVQDESSAFSKNNINAKKNYKCDKKDASNKLDHATNEFNFVEVRTHDVLCGRGGMTNNHFGNKRFRDLVHLHRPDYIAKPKIRKPDVARLIVKTIRSDTPSGRFLKKDQKTGKWYEISDRKAAEKASQALREKLFLSH